jgi:hypothetical protein
MAADNLITTTISSTRRSARRLRTIAVIVLLSGMVAGLVVYWAGSPPADLSGDVATADTSKKVQRDIEMNVGKMGLFASDLLDDLQYPGTQAAIIVVTAALVAGGCLYFARLLDLDDGESAGKTDSPPGS